MEFLLTKEFIYLKNKWYFFLLVKTCASLPIPDGGQMNCFHPDLGLNYDGSEKMLPVDSVCAFNCKNGTKLTGSKLRTCLPLAKWDGLRTTCKRNYFYYYKQTTINIMQTFYQHSDRKVLTTCY